MYFRCLTVCAVLGSLLIFSACDPEATIKEKVPSPVKDVLTFGEPPKPTGPPKPQVTLDITSPLPTKVYSTNEAVTFQVKLNIGGEEKPTVPPSFVWQLTPEKKTVMDLGHTPTVSKMLDAGKYEVQVTASVDAQKVVKKANFRVALQMPGKVVDADNKPMTGTEVLITELDDDKVFSKGRVDNTGTFLAELPSDRYMAIRPEKAGYTFSPSHIIVKYSPAPIKLDFKGIPSTIANLHLADPKNPAGVVENICPNDPVLLAFDIKAPTRPRSYQAFLVRREHNREELIQLEPVTGSGGTGSPSAESQKLLLQLPVTITPEVSSFLCRIRLTVTDEKGATYSVQPSHTVNVDFFECFGKDLATGGRFLEEGKAGQAVEEYDLMERLGKNIEDIEQIATQLEKMRFNRGLAELMLALEKKPGADRDRTQPALGKAIVDFNAVLRRSEQDSQVLLLRALAAYLSENYGLAARDCTDLVTMGSETNHARIIRAFAYVKSGIVGDFSQAVDDLTEVITNDPGRDDLRQLRNQVFELLGTQHDKSSRDRLDTSDIQIPNPAIGLNLKQYIRK